MWCSYCKRNNHSTQNYKKKPRSQEHKNTNTQPTSSTYDPSKFCNYCKNKWHNIHECRKRQSNKTKFKRESFKLVTIPNNDRPIGGFSNSRGVRAISTPRIISNLQNNSNQRFLTFKSNNSDQNLKILIDTGASISRIKHNALNPIKTILNPKL